jgi:putative transposase
VTAHQAVHPVATMCRVLGVSPSGYYAWRKRPLSMRARANVELTAHIEGIHRLSRGTYGAPRIHAELAARGLPAGHNRVARLIRHAGVQGVSRRKSCRTTVRDETARPAPDLVDRHVTATGPDRLWVADITYVPTGAGVLYLADEGFSRTVHGDHVVGGDLSQRHRRLPLVLRYRGESGMQRWVGLGVIAIRCLKSRARNHLPTNTSLLFQFEVTA